MAHSAQDLYDAGRLADAIKAQTDEVRARPADPERRFVLFTLLAFDGDLTRAARQLDALGAAGASAGGAIEMRSLLCRALLAAEDERRAVWEGRAKPLLAPGSDAVLEPRLSALAKLRASDAPEIERLLAASNALLQPLRGTLNGRAFDQIRDSDDFSAPVLEVFAQGRCMWLPFDQIRRLEIEPPQSMLDLLWTPARLVDARGNDANVTLPALYAGTHADGNDLLRLGRVTEWRDAAGVAARSVGQKVLLTAGASGEEEWSLLDVRVLEIAP
jgi:type VI secretion system protein ImpE